VSDCLFGSSTVGWFNSARQTAFVPNRRAYRSRTKQMVMSRWVFSRSLRLLARSEIPNSWQNKSSFTGKELVLDTDTRVEIASKVFEHLFKAFAPNLPGLPGTYATDSIVNAGSGQTDAFGRERSMAQALASSIGVKLGSYPEDVMRRNVMGKNNADKDEITKVIKDLQRRHLRNTISDSDFESKMEVQREKLRKLNETTREKVAQ
jgi:Holliday junction resolvasome RuvABC endonuclease subunit